MFQWVGHSHSREHLIGRNK